MLLSSNLSLLLNLFLYPPIIVDNNFLLKICCEIVKNCYED